MGLLNVICTLVTRKFQLRLTYLRIADWECRSNTPLRSRRLTLVRERLAMENARSCSRERYTTKSLVPNNG